MGRNHVEYLQIARVQFERLNRDFRRYIGNAVQALRGYVKATNELTERIAAIVGKGIVDHEDLPAYSELKRRLGFEYNGMVLHEYYFDNLTGKGSDEPILVMDVWEHAYLLDYKPSERAKYIEAFSLSGTHYLRERLAKRFTRCEPLAHGV